MILVRFTIDNRNRLIFYGNTVGYVKDDAAVVDEMFQTDELSRYLARLNLTPQWKEGVFDRLAAGEAPGEELGQPQKGCRIWQLRKGVDIQQRRMSQAEYLLAHTDLQIGQIAQTIGYSTSSRFAELFRRSTGLLPLEYRKMAKRK